MARAYKTVELEGLSMSEGVVKGVERYGSRSNETNVSLKPVFKKYDPSIDEMIAACNRSPDKSEKVKAFSDFELQRHIRELGSLDEGQIYRVMSLPVKQGETPIRQYLAALIEEDISIGKGDHEFGYRIAKNNDHRELVLIRRREADNGRTRSI